MSRSSYLGFTLIEVLLVVAILGLLAGVIVANIGGKGAESARKIAEVDIEGLSNSVEMYKLDNGRYPTTDQGLQALVERPADATKWTEGGYLKKSEIPKDPWDTPYQYVNNNGLYDIFSYGEDGVEGGEGNNADIHYRSQGQ